MKIKIRSVLMIVALTFAVAGAPRTHAVVPPPDGGYPNFTTAEGTNALKNLTTGAANTAIGWYSLFGDTTASFNTGVGAGTLLFNNGDQNTAVGAVALLNNTTGGFNTATGVSALSSNTTGVSNNAFGWGALLSNTTGTNNTAIGVRALQSNTEGDANVAVGETALSSTTGSFNTAIGYQALFSNTAVSNNTAIGAYALQNNTTGVNNTALGYIAGQDITGSGNVCIGVGMVGAAGVNSTTWIRNVYSSVATARQVYVDEDNKIGTQSSSRRYKEDIKAMDTASETLFALKPVTFRYKKEIDRSHALSFGLIAEEVANISPDLITRDEEGQPQTVRYEAVNAMLLNEFLKEHRRTETLQATIRQLKSDATKQKETISELKKDVGGLTSQLKEQAAQIQKVSTQVKSSKTAGRVASAD